MIIPEGIKGGVVVTGVSSGIGAAIAHNLLANGYKVFGSLRKATPLEGISDDLLKNFTPLIFDVRDRYAVLEAAQLVREEMQGKPLCGLINNAGLAKFGPMECIDDKTFYEIIEVNVIGVRTVTNAFLPLLRGATSYSPGKIINISSLSGIINTPMNGTYCVSKHALESMTEIYRRELLPSGIDVVSIRSGPVRSEIWNKTKSDEDVFKDDIYQKMSKKARSIMKAAEREAIPASDIAELVDGILSGQKNRSAYHMSKGAFIARLLRWLPTRLTDRIIVKSMVKDN